MVKQGNKIKTESLVSIIIPTYNRAKLLKRAINSCLKQTYRNIEVIVIDDGSTDDTEQVVKSFIDKRVVYIKNKTNKGIPATRNIGLNIATGEFIGFLDHDDEYLPEKIEEQVKVLIDNPGIGFVVCERYDIEENGKIKKKGPADFILQQILVRKKCFEKIGGFDERFYSMDDSDMMARLTYFFKREAINRPLVIKYQYKNMTSRNISAEKFIQDSILFYTKHKDRLKRKRQSNLFYDIGKGYLKLKNFKLAGMWFLKAFLHYPLRRGFLINLQPILKILRFVIPGLFVQYIKQCRKTL